MENALLERARTGDELAFGELVGPHQRELQVHCYRMLGSLTEAEDMLQETLLSAWRGLAGFEGRSSVRAWLYRIATNQCLNARRAASRRVPAEPVPPFQPPEPTSRDEITWLQPYPDELLDGVPHTAQGPAARYQAREAVELAFVAGLQRLAPRQAAVLVFCDVLGFSGTETAALMETTPAAVKGALQRARAAMGRERGPAPPRPDAAAERALASRFADAYLAADVEGLMALLTDDAWLSMPPAPHQYRGRAAIRAFPQASFGFRGSRAVFMLPARANGQIAFGSYLAGQDGLTASPAGLFVLTMAGARISALTRFHLDHLYPRFGLTESVSAGAGIGRRPGVDPAVAPGRHPQLDDPAGAGNHDKQHAESGR